MIERNIERLDKFIKIQQNEFNNDQTKKVKTGEDSIVVGGYILETKIGLGAIEKEIIFKNLRNENDPKRINLPCLSKLLAIDSNENMFFLIFSPAYPGSLDTKFCYMNLYNFSNGEFEPQNESPIKIPKQVKNEDNRYDLFDVNVYQNREGTSIICRINDKIVRLTLNSSYRQTNFSTILSLEKIFSQCCRERKVKLIGVKSEPRKVVLCTDAHVEGKGLFYCLLSHQSNGFAVSPYHLRGFKDFESLSTDFYSDRKDDFNIERLLSTYKRKKKNMRRRFSFNFNYESKKEVVVGGYLLVTELGSSKDIREIFFERLSKNNNKSEKKILLPCSKFVFAKSNKSEEILVVAFSPSYNQGELLDGYWYINYYNKDLALQNEKPIYMGWFNEVYMNHCLFDMNVYCFKPRGFISIIFRNNESIERVVLGEKSAKRSKTKFFLLKTPEEKVRFFDDPDSDKHIIFRCGDDDSNCSASKLSHTSEELIVDDKLIAYRRDYKKKGSGVGYLKGEDFSDDYIKFFSIEENFAVFHSNGGAGKVLCIYESVKWSDVKEDELLEDKFLRLKNSRVTIFNFDYEMIPVQRSGKLEEFNMFIDDLAQHVLGALNFRFMNEIIFYGIDDSKKSFLLFGNATEGKFTRAINFISREQLLNFKHKLEIILRYEKFLIDCLQIMKNNKENFLESVLVFISNKFGEKFERYIETKELLEKLKKSLSKKFSGEYKLIEEKKQTFLKKYLLFSFEEIFIFDLKEKIQKKMKKRTEDEEDEGEEDVFEEKIILKKPKKLENEKVEKFCCDNVSLSVSEKLISFFIRDFGLIKKDLMSLLGSFEELKKNLLLQINELEEKYITLKTKSGEGEAGVWLKKFEKCLKKRKEEAKELSSKENERMKKLFTKDGVFSQIEERLALIKKDREKKFEENFSLENESLLKEKEKKLREFEVFLKKKIESFSKNLRKILEEMEKRVQKLQESSFKRNKNEIRRDDNDEINNEDEEEIMKDDEKEIEKEEEETKNEEEEEIKSNDDEKIGNDRKKETRNDKNEEKDSQPVVQPNRRSLSRTRNVV